MLRHLLNPKSLLLLLFFLIGLSLSANAQAIIADHSCIPEFDLIPDSVVEDIAADFEFVYGHTSHGSQIMTGMDIVETENASFNQPTFSEFADDLGTLGDTSWVATLRWRIESGGYNFAMMSWCGGVSTNTEGGINVYLDKMDELESDYPQVTFIYMTGHLDGSGTDGNLYAMNDLIRSYCAQNGKILFDFADIESFDPDGTFYPDGSDACEWCEDWCAQHACPSCASCAHSHCFNCYQKGMAFWWLMARMDGWVANTEPPGCGDVNNDNLINLLDILFLIDYKYKNGPAPDPLLEADVDLNGVVNLLDILYLIDYKYKEGPDPDCLK